MVPVGCSENSSLVMGHCDFLGILWKLSFETLGEFEKKNVAYRYSSVSRLAKALLIMGGMTRSVS